MSGPWEDFKPPEDGPWADFAPKPSPKNGSPGAAADPTADMSTLDRLRAGAGRGMTAAGRAAAGFLGATPLGAINRAVHQALPGLPGRLPTPQEADAARNEAAQIDAPLLATGAGKVGNAIGFATVAAPTALIPGANTALGAALIGGGAGGLTTEGGLTDRARSAAFGAAGGLAGKFAGNALGAGARALANRSTQHAAAVNAAAAPRMSAAQAGAREGYVVPPADLQPGIVTEALSGLSGKIKTAQAASARNQGVTNDLAARALGLPRGQPITPDALQALRTNAGSTGYAPIRAAGEVTADGTYGKALDAIAGQYQGAARSFPGAAKNPVLEMVDGLRQPKFDAGDALDMVRVLRESADQAYRAGNSGLGKASKAAASALEDQLERHLTAAGDSGALQAFRAARQEIAKTYSVQKGLNLATGDVSAAALARQMQSGTPLSGDLRTIAEFSTAFPKATQALKEAPKAWSPLDALAGGGGIAMGSPGLMAMAAARPAARSLLLSGPYQAAALGGGAAPGLLTQLPAAVLEQQLIRRGAPGLLGVLAAQGLTSE
jgi:hypothetical protein